MERRRCVFAPLPSKIEVHPFCRSDAFMRHLWPEVIGTRFLTASGACLSDQVRLISALFEELANQKKDVGKRQAKQTPLRRDQANYVGGLDLLESIHFLLHIDAGMLPASA